MTPDNLLAGLAARACKDPYFLGHALAAYQERNGLDDAGLAARLACAPAALTSLRLCRRPGAAAPDGSAAEDVRSLAAHHGLDDDALGRVLAEAAALPPPREPGPRPGRRRGWAYVHKDPRP
jgi:hypothetical protein